MFYNRIILEVKADKKEGEKNVYGLQVNLLPEIKEDIINRVKLEYPDTTNEEIENTLDVYLTTKIAAYPDLCKHSINIWKMKLDAIEHVFSGLSKEELVKFVILLITWHSLIKQELDKLDEGEEQSQSLFNLCGKISNDILQIDEEIKLFERIKRYGDTLKLTLDPNIGGREQDTPELTFKEEHLRDVYYITIISKIFLPLFNIMINESKKSAAPQKRMWEGKNKFLIIKNKIIDTRIKEIYCLAFVEPLIKKHLNPTYKKLEYYVSYFIEKTRRKPKDNECSDVFMNNSTEELTKNILANLVCKKYVSINLYDENDNIMGKTSNTIKQRVKSFEKGQNSKVYFIRSVGSNIEDDNIDSKSQLEVDSIFCETLLDNEPIIKKMWVDAIEKYITKYELDYNFFLDVVQWNKDNHLLIEYHMPLFLSTVFSEDFGGCEAINVLNYNEIISLITLVQLIAVKRNCYDLAHRLSGQIEYNEGVIVTVPRTVEAQIMIDTSEEVSRIIYHDLLACRTRLVIGDKNKTLSREFRSKLKTLSIYLAESKVNYKTYPKLCELMGIGIEDMYRYQPSRHLLAQYCMFLYEKV